MSGYPEETSSCNSHAPSPGFSDKATRNMSVRQTVIRARLRVAFGFAFLFDCF